MTDIDKIEDTEEAWDNNILGNDARFAEVATDVNQANIDEALGLKMISIRLENDLIDAFKNIASLRGGIGYQTLMRQVLKRFADCEMKQLLRDAAANAVKAAEAVAVAKPGKVAPSAVAEGRLPPKRHKKAA